MVIISYIFKEILLDCYSSNIVRSLLDYYIMESLYHYSSEIVVNLIEDLIFTFYFFSYYIYFFKFLINIFVDRFSEGRNLSFD
jgi:hypothetical protein